MNRSHIVAATAVVVVLALLISYATLTTEEPEDDGMTFTLLSDGTAALSDYTGEAKSLVIPETVEIDGVERTVSTILYGALSYNDSITHVTVPAGVTNIVTSALLIPSLLWIEVDDGNTTYSSVDGVLFDEDGTRLCQFPSGRTGAYTVPDGVTTIGDAAFVLCSLTEVTISDSVTTMGMSVFIDSADLEVIRIGSRLSSIGNWCFIHCPSLGWIEVDEANPHYDSVDGVLYSEGMETLLRYPQARGGTFEIPSEVTSVGLYAFAYNSALTSVTIPSSVTSIGVCAFFYCSGLKEIVIQGDVPTVGELAFYLSDGTGTVYCTVYGPEGCLDGYKGSDTVLYYSI